MKNLKSKIVGVMLLLMISSYSNAAFFPGKISTIKLEGTATILVHVDQTIQECGGSSVVIFREALFAGGTAEQKKDMMDKVYAALLTAYFSDTSVVIGTNGCEGPSMKGVAIHLNK